MSYISDIDLVSETKLMVSRSVETFYINVGQMNANINPINNKDN